MKPLLILTIPLLVGGYLVLHSDWYKWRDFASECRDEGAKYELCKGTPMCHYEDGKIAVPTVGYGESYKVGEGYGDDIKLDDAALSAALQRFQDTLQPMNVDPSCL